MQTRSHLRMAKLYFKRRNYTLFVSNLRKAYQSYKDYAKIYTMGWLYTQHSIIRLENRKMAMQELDINDTDILITREQAKTL